MNNTNLVFRFHSHRTGGLHWRYLHRDSTLKRAILGVTTCVLRYSTQMSQIHLQYNSARDFGRFILEMWQNSFTIQ